MLFLWLKKVPGWYGRAGFGSYTFKTAANIRGRRSGSMTWGLCTGQSSAEWDISTIEKAAVSACVLTLELLAYTISAINKASLQPDQSEEWLLELEETIRIKYNNRLEELQKYIMVQYAETEYREEAKRLKDFIEATIIKMGTIPILLRA